MILNTNEIIVVSLETKTFTYTTKNTLDCESYAVYYKKNYQYLIGKNCSNYEISANTYLFKFNYRNARKKCEICSMLTIKTPERRH